jgi:hypothetical protein
MRGSHGVDHIDMIIAHSIKYGFISIGGEVYRHLLEVARSTEVDSIACTATTVSLGDNLVRVGNLVGVNKYHGIC